MEGLEDEAVTFPRGTPVAKTEFKCILDPIDGTRNLMYDKRSAWVLAAVAPQRGRKTHLGDLVVAAMTELPTSKQWAADQISGVKGCGLRGLVAERVDVRGGGRSRLTPRPSQATDFKHGFASMARFFPEGKALLAQVEEGLWDALYGPGGNSSPLVFDDQYITTGGQIYELLVGHDRMLGDLRPRAFRKLGLESPLVCHPYDICTALLLQEAGGVVETPEGTALRAPLDTTSPVAWMGYANPGPGAPGTPRAEAADEGAFRMSTSRWQGEAPGRLDFLGGVADYSGSLVLQTPIRARTRVTITPLVRTAPRAGQRAGRARSCCPCRPAPSRHRPGKSPPCAPGWTSTRPRTGRATPSAASCCSAGPRTGGRRAGCKFAIASEVPASMGVSSSAALEVADPPRPGGSRRAGVSRARPWPVWRSGRKTTWSGRRAG